MRIPCVLQSQKGSVVWEGEKDGGGANLDDTLQRVQIKCGMELGWLGWAGWAGLGWVHNSVTRAGVGEQGEQGRDRLNSLFTSANRVGVGEQGE